MNDIRIKTIIRLTGKKDKNECDSYNAKVESGLQTFHKYRDEMSEQTTMDKTGWTSDRNIYI